MSILDAILLGLVQGLTEFLPISSSGHLQIAKEILGVEITGNVTFDVILHAATVLSTIVVMWSEILRLIKGLFSKKFTPEQSFVLKIILSMIPAGVVGILFSSQIEQLFLSLYFVGAMLLLTATLLTFAYYAKPKPKSEISYRDAFIIGCAQAVATMPGLSRSGSTIAMGLILGNSKQTVAQFSFLMVIPVILGKILLDMLSGEITAMDVDIAPLFAGFMSAFISGALACRFMLEIVRRGKLVWFAAYCLVAGLICIIYSI